MYFKRLMNGFAFINISALGKLMIFDSFKTFQSGVPMVVQDWQAHRSTGMKVRSSNGNQPRSTHCGSVGNESD